MYFTNIERNTKMTIAQAINSIIMNYGIEVLSSPNKVQSMVQDYVTGYEREKKMFQSAGPGASGADPEADVLQGVSRRDLRLCAGYIEIER